MERERKSQQVKIADICSTLIIRLSYLSFFLKIALKFLFYNTLNSMKYQKSSYSLYSQPFQQQNTITASYSRSNSIFKRSNPNQKDTSVVYNARGKLNSCLNQLQEMQNQIEVMNANNKELSLELTFLREEYHVRRMNELQNQLANSVKQLKKRVTIGNRSDLLKYQSLNQIMGSLYKNQKQIKSKMDQIESRIYELQNIMGNNTH